MTEIKRYDVVSVDGVPAHRPSESGRWVKHEDHAAIVAALQEQMRALAAECTALKSAITIAKDEMQGHYDSDGVDSQDSEGNFMDACIRLCDAQSTIDKIENTNTPATDAALREIRAQAVESFMSWSDSHIEEGDEYEQQLREVSSACKVFAARIRAGDK